MNWTTRHISGCFDACISANQRHSVLFHASRLPRQFLISPPQGPIWGKCYDNYGPRQLLLAGSFLHVFGLMMASLWYDCNLPAASPWPRLTHVPQFRILPIHLSPRQALAPNQSINILADDRPGVCSPIGASLIFYPAMSSTGTWFFKRRALAFGIMAAGSSLGGVILPIMVDRIIARAGFPWAMRGAAFLLLALLIYANLTVRSRLPPSPKPWSLMEFVLPFRELPFSLVVFASFLFFAGMFLPFTFVILSAQHDGMSERLAAYLVPILNAGKSPHVRLSSPRLSLSTGAALPPCPTQKLSRTPLKTRYTRPGF